MPWYGAALIGVAFALGFALAYIRAHWLRRAALSIAMLLPVIGPLSLDLLTRPVDASSNSGFALAVTFAIVPFWIAFLTAGFWTKPILLKPNS